MPEDSRFNTVPADYLNISCNVRQICIPGNIKYIKTRSFAGTSGTGRMCYIWTTGPDPLVKYDNGAAFVNGDETTWKYMNNAGEGNVAMTASDYNQFQYGTFTLPAGLELIERFAFSQSTSVSDVYVLNPVAPECHVDAFNCTMYLANNTLQPQYIKDGIVTREAYRNDESGTEYKFVSILHYPRETTDPNIQRYTDPTREYSIATGERDGNGRTVDARYRSYALHIARSVVVQDGKLVGRLPCRGDVAAIGAQGAGRGVVGADGCGDGYLVVIGLLGEVGVVVAASGKCQSQCSHHENLCCFHCRFIFNWFYTVLISMKMDLIPVCTVHCQEYHQHSQPAVPTVVST